MLYGDIGVCVCVCVCVCVSVCTRHIYLFDEGYILWLNGLWQTFKWLAAWLVFFLTSLFFIWMHVVFWLKTLEHYAYVCIFFTRSQYWVMVRLHAFFLCPSVEWKPLLITACACWNVKAPHCATRPPPPSPSLNTSHSTLPLSPPLHPPPPISHLHHGELKLQSESIHSRKLS